eukprot:TRINITY_DN23803_c0_g1_i1.p1 TRINITY_DN23803_c0_g1~~TRINITY_DN23803_c0_g1_i1.p1  ORF type:complete len:225 (+),score=31.10 TRINITY_DN23803_c0_g1_i1:42-716(+)
MTLAPAAHRPQELSVRLSHPTTRTEQTAIATEAQLAELEVTSIVSDESSAGAVDSASDSDAAPPACSSTSGSDGSTEALNFSFEHPVCLSGATGTGMQPSRLTSDSVAPNIRPVSIDDPWTSDEECEAPENAAPVSWKIIMKGKVIDEVRYYVTVEPNSATLRSCISPKALRVASPASSISRQSSVGASSEEPGLRNEARRAPTLRGLPLKVLFSTEDPSVRLF